MVVQHPDQTLMMGSKVDSRHGSQMGIYNLAVLERPFHQWPCNAPFNVHWLRGLNPSRAKIWMREKGPSKQETRLPRSPLPSPL